MNLYGKVIKSLAFTFSILLKKPKCCILRQTVTVANNF